MIDPTEPPEVDAHYISLGAGVQSSTMLLMAARGLIEPRPEAAIFADTGWEPTRVYRHLDWLAAEAGRLGIEVHRVHHGDLRADHVSAADGALNYVPSIPFFTETGMMMRQCTRTYKIRPTRARIRRLALAARPDKTIRTIRVASWIGISTDEISRVKPFPVRWNVPRWPLIELGMTRADCRAWFAEYYPERALPRSACIACPFRTNAEWRDIRDDPGEWADAVAFDEHLRDGFGHKHSGELLVDGPLYLHASRLPLVEAPIDTGADDETGAGNECEGGCFL